MARWGGLITYDKNEGIALGVPGARLALLRNAGHFSFIEKLEVVRKEIGEFLQG